MIKEAHLKKRLRSKNIAKATDLSVETVNSALSRGMFSRSTEEKIRKEFDSAIQEYLEML